MDTLIQLITQFAQNNSTIVIVLFFLSEALASIDSIKGNSVFQIVKNVLNGLREAVLAKPPVQPPPPPK